MSVPLQVTQDLILCNDPTTPSLVLPAGYAVVNSTITTTKAEEFEHEHLFNP